VLLPYLQVERSQVLTRSQVIDMVLWNSSVSFGFNVSGRAGTPHVMIQIGPYTMPYTTPDKIIGATYSNFAWIWNKTPQDMGFPNKTADYTGFLRVNYVDNQDNILSVQSIQISLHVDAVAPSQIICPEGYAYDDTQAKCVSTTPPPTPPPSPPKTPDDLTKLFNDIKTGPSSWNLGDIAKYFGTILGDIVQVGIDVLGTITTDFWNALPDWLKNSITGFNNWLLWWDNLLKNPEQWFNQLVQGVFKKSSPSIAENASDAMASWAQKVSGKYATKDNPVGSLLMSILQPILDYGASFGTQLVTPSDVNDAQIKAAQLDDNLTKLFIGVGLTTYAIEVASLGQVETGTSLALAWLQARGIFDIIGKTVGPYYDHNIGRMLEYSLNKRFPNAIPDLASMMRLHRRGRMTTEVFNDLAAQVSAIRQDWLALMESSNLILPTIDDVIVWNRRHPNQAIGMQDASKITEMDTSLSVIEGVTTLDLLNERAYVDLGLQTVAMLYQLGKVDENDVKFEIALQGYRTKALPGQARSHADMAFQWVTSYRDLAWLRQELLQARTDYANGVIDQASLHDLASTVIQSDDGLKAFMAAADFQKTRIGTPRTKAKTPFTTALLIQLLKEGDINEAFVDDDLSAAGWDDKHHAALKRYIMNKVSASTSSATSSQG
jgi:hypothetical protein